MRTRSARRAARRVAAASASLDPFDEIDIREDVRHLLLGLTPRQRAALVLLDLYDYGSEEAGRIMGIRPSTVRALATQGRNALRYSGGSDG
jgi:RNA polymerase sigma-70 factor, ECF subfamily